MNKTFAMMMATVTAFAGVSETRADDIHGHLNVVTYDLVRETASLAREVRYGYVHHPEFGELYGNVVEMYRCAVAIHGGAAFPHRLFQVKQDAAKLDELFHCVDETICQVESQPHWGNRYHRNRALAVMRVLDETVHHLLDDLDVACVKAAAPPVVAPPVPAPVVPPAPVLNPPHTRFPATPSRPVIVTPSRPVFVNPGRPSWNYNRGAGFTYRSKNGRFAITFGR